MEEIKRIDDVYNALIVGMWRNFFLGGGDKLGERWVETGTLGDYNVISFNGNNVLKMLEDADFCNKVTEIAA